MYETHTYKHHMATQPPLGKILLFNCLFKGLNSLDLTDILQKQAVCSDGFNNELFFHYVKNKKNPITIHYVYWTQAWETERGR